MTKRQRIILGTIITLLGGSFWGLSGVCGQYLLEVHNISPSFIVPYRLLISGLIMLVFFLVKDFKKSTEVWKSKKLSLELLFYSLFGIMICQYTFFVTIDYSNAATATVLQYLAPVVIMVLVCLKNKKPPQIWELLAIICAMLGVFFIATHGRINTLAISKNALVVGLLSMITVVVYNLAAKNLLKLYSATLILAWAMTIGGIVLSLALKPWNYDVNITKEVFIAFFGVIFFGTICAFSMYMTGVKMIGPVKASLYASVEPVIATVLTGLFLNTKFHFYDIVGFVFIISTVFILSIPDIIKEK